MPSGSTLAIFVAVSLVFVAVPGPDVIYVMTRGIGQGRRAAVMSALGLNTGVLVHIAAASVGISALLASSVTAFSIVKYTGAAYLIYLGVKTLRNQGQDRLAGVVIDSSPANARRAYLQGIVVNLTNPKAALFFAALLPQFVHADRGGRLTQILVLAIIVYILGIAADMTYALAAGSVGIWLKRRPGFLRRQHYVTGGIYLALGVAAAAVGGNNRHAP